MRRRSFLAIVIGAGVAACSDGGVIPYSLTDAATDAPANASDAIADAVADTSDAATTQTFVGAVSGTDARVGFVVENGKAFLFFCGGAQTYATHTKWFRGSLALSSPFTLTQPTGNATASGSLQMDGSVSGTFDRGDGVPLAWSAVAANPATAAGLYEANTADGTAALIVTQAMPADTAILQGAFKLAMGGVIQQVVPLMPIQDGFRVQITLEAGVMTLDMTRAHPH